ncbi:hypothetical protein [Leptospira noguchii]|uniref:hypothetical protein n=1 Tax=Leptospira noguchii TaxID=28182 RepID=UPI000568A622|nr:hypothetical protein [Leptospira noguchii]
MDRVGNSTQRSLWIALETQHNALYGSRWKLNTTLSMDRVGNSTQRSLWIALETKAQRSLWIALETKAQRSLWIALETKAQRFPMGRVGN